MKRILVCILLAAGCGGDDNGSDAGRPAADAPVGGDTAADTGSDTATADTGGSEPAGAPRVGGPCSTAAECPSGGSGTPACLTDGYPGGYCAIPGCSAHGHDCPNDPGQETLSGPPDQAKCVRISSGLACMGLCRNNADCREGYTCGSLPDASGHGTVRACVPN